MGKGASNSSLLLPPKGDLEAEADYEKSQDASRREFKIKTCGERDSELHNFDRYINNVTETIKKHGKDLIERAKQALGGSERRKRQSEGGNFACAKVRLGSTSYASCVKKISSIAFNCTSAVNDAFPIFLCYCHDNNCNAANDRSSNVLQFLAIVSVTFILNF